MRVLGSAFVITLLVDSSMCYSSTHSPTAFHPQQRQQLAFRTLGVSSLAQTLTTTTRLQSSVSADNPLDAPESSSINNSMLMNPLLFDEQAGASIVPATATPPHSNNNNLFDGVRRMDANALINWSLVVGVSTAILFQLTSLEADLSLGWTVGETLARMPVDLWTMYATALETHPIAVKAATSATVYTIGDIIAQKTTGAAIGEMDRGRVLRSLIAGGIGHGPLSHFWYLFCDNFFENVLHWTAWWAFLPKIVVDQTMWGPVWNGSYIALLGLMKLERPSSILSDIQRSTIPLMVSGLKLWPLAHCVTYGLLPVENRLLWVDMVEILWVTILASTASSLGHEEKDKAAEL